MLKRANISWNARQLSKMISKGTITFDNAVQRGLVWDNDRKSLLIHSMIEGYPIPPMYAAKSDGKYDFLDGKQRTNCISDFLNGKFTLQNVPEITLEDGTEVDINGKFFSGLSEDVQDIISNYSLTIYYFEDITEDEISEMFFRLNHGKPLTSIELSRSKAKDLDTIQSIGKHELFTTALTEKAFERYTHEDMVIKSYIMLTSETPCLDTKSVRPTMETAVFTEDDINTLNAVYDRILSAYKAIIADDSAETGKISKRIAKRLLTRTHMLSILPIVKKSIDDGVDIEVFTNWVKNFFCGTKSVTKYDDYNCRCTSGSGHAESIKIRLRVINKDYEVFMKNYRKETKDTESVNDESVDTVNDIADNTTNSDADADTETNIDTSDNIEFEIDSSVEVANDSTDEINEVSDVSDSDLSVVA